jgi:uncharacterized membrane protein YsdA (DUF1294 family)
MNTVANHHNPYSSFALMSVVLTFGLAAVFAFKLGTDWTLSILMGLNATAFALHGFDKSAAQKGKLRVPERIFWFMVLCGGAVGTLLGMKFFRHKTKKASYQLMVLLLIVVHLAIVHYGLGYDLTPPKLRSQKQSSYDRYQR